MKKFMVVFLLLMVGTFCISAVSNAQVTEILLWQNLDRPEDPYFYDLIDKFNETHPHIHVNFELVPASGMRDKYINAIITGTAADVIYEGGLFTELWKMGGLTPLNEYIENWEGAKNIQDSMWSVTKFPDNNYYYVPVFTLPMYLYYRADWFEELGIKEIETREDFLEAAKKITENIDGAYGFGMRGASYGSEMWRSFVLPVVDNKWYDENGNSTFRDPEAVAANQWYMDLYSKHKVVPPTAPTDGFNEIIEGFQTGLTGMVFHHIMSSTDMIEALGYENVGISSGFSINGVKHNDVSVFGYCITENSKNKDAAFEFISWISKKEQQIYLSKHLGVVPTYKGIEEYDPLFKENKFMEASIKTLSHAYVRPLVSQYSQWQQDVWVRNFQRGLLGEVTSEQMMLRFAELFEEGYSELLEASNNN